MMTWMDIKKQFSATDGKKLIDWRLMNLLISRRIVETGECKSCQSSLVRYFSLVGDDATDDEEELMRKVIKNLKTFELYLTKLFLNH